MKHILLIVGLALCAPLALNAQITAPATPMASTAGKLKKTEYHGTVKSVDTGANTLTVTNKKGDLTLAVAATTKITQNKKAATLADITMGEKVSGSYTKDASGTMTACKVNGHSAPASPAAMTPAPAAATTPSTP